MAKRRKTLNESECGSVEGYYDKVGEDYHITVYTKNW